MKKSILLFLFALSSVTYGQSPDFEYSFMENYSVVESANLDISADDGVTLTSYEGKDIKVYYVVRKMNNVLEVDKEEMEVLTKRQWVLNINKTPKRLKIDVNTKPGHIKPEDKINLDFRVYVPARTNVELKSADGDILVSGLDSDQRYIANDGDIRLENLKGRIHVETFDGDILMDNVSGIVESDAHDGQVIEQRN